MGGLTKSSAKSVNATVLCIGSPQSGKTSILYTLKMGSNLESAKDKGADQDDINVIPPNVHMNP